MAKHPRTSRERYLGFVDDYRRRRLDESTEANGTKPVAAQTEERSPKDEREKKKAARRMYVRAYLRWLRPHRFAIGLVFTLALLRAGLEMIEPLFMRYIIDHVLLNRALDAAARLVRLHFAGLTFLAVIIVSSAINVFKDYRQRRLNVQVTLSLRRSLFHRLLHADLSAGISQTS